MNEQHTRASVSFALESKRSELQRKSFSLHAEIHERNQDKCTFHSHRIDMKRISACNHAAFHVRRELRRSHLKNDTHNPLMSRARIRNHAKYHLETHEVDGVTATLSKS